MGLFLPTNKNINEIIDKKITELKITPESVIVPSDETFKLCENYAWYHYTAVQLLEFYKSYVPLNEFYNTNSFYRVFKSEKTPCMHYPLAQTLTKAMVDLVFANMPTVNANTGKPETDEKINELIQKIYDDNKMPEIFYKAATMLSYSGAVAFKIVMDPEVSEYPIVIPYAKEDILISKKYGRVQEIAFKDYKYQDGKTYVLFTRVRKGSYTYELYRKEGSDLKRVDLSTVPEYANLVDTGIISENGRMACVYMENNGNAKSDYEGIIDDFALADELQTSMADFIRKSKIKVYRPQNTCKYDPKAKRYVLPTDYDTEYILYDSDPQADKPERQTIQRDIVDVSGTLTGYREQLTDIIKHAALQMGLSPATIGIDASGANSSGLALEIRERVSLRTRSEKIKKWIVSITELTELLLSMYMAKASGNTIFLPADLDGKISVSFGEYTTPTYESMVNILGNALNNNLIDLNTALTELYPNKSEEEIEIMISNITGQLPTAKTIEENEIMNEETKIEKAGDFEN